MTHEELHNHLGKPAQPEKPKFTAFYNRHPMFFQVSADSADALAAKVAEIDARLAGMGIAATPITEN
jgi:hypothetical protein